ncbi:MAG: nucleoside 2-deoxyribosyltransferase domain-containing protein [Ruminococcus sp.]|nr:nucleoside 2-deoxyribosyltransferase domain-containing protein [Ruminococcus sp.]
MHIITVCGSGKNKEFIHRLCDLLSDKGFTVLKPPLHNIAKYKASIDYEAEFLMWKGATHAHLNRIKKSDICIMANFDGYLGVGSSIELGYAAALGKFIIALQHDQELAREALFDFVLETENCIDIVNKIEKMIAK